MNWREVFLLKRWFATFLILRALFRFPFLLSESTCEAMKPSVRMYEKHMRKQKMSFVDIACWGGIFVIAIAIAGWFFLGSVNTSDSKLDEFLTDLQEGQYLKVQEALSAETYQAMILMYGKITPRVLDKHYQPWNMKEYSFSLLGKTKKSARYKIRIMNSNGAVQTDMIDMVRQGGQWKVSSF